MAWNVYPTQTPVGTWQAVASNRAREFQHAAWLNYLHQSPLHSFRCSGGVFTKGAGDSLDIPTGIYIIDGFAVQNDAAENLVITATRPTYLYATLTLTGSLITGATYYSNTTGVAPSDSYVAIGMIGTLASDTNYCFVAPTFPVAVDGSVTWDSGDNTDIFLGFKPSMVSASFEGHGSVLHRCGASGYIYSVDSGPTITLQTLGFQVGAYAGGVLGTNTLTYTAWV